MNWYTCQKNNQSGQILLILLLLLAIASTVALSLIGRTTLDVAISRQLEESARAFNAAEAGIEQALLSGSGGTYVVSAGTSSNVQVQAVGGTSGLYEIPRITNPDSTENIWMVNHDGSGALIETPTYTASDINVCWRNSEGNTPALTVAVLYKTAAGSYRVGRVSYDPDGSRAATNNFTSVPGAGTGCTLSGYYERTISFASLGINPVSDTILALRIRPLYNEAAIALFTASQSLPEQGKRIESTGSTDNGTTRKVIVYHQYSAPATIFDAVVFSQSIFEH